MEKLVESALRQTVSLAKPENRKRCIIILGMHRSGTSALTRIANLLGAKISTNLLPNQPDNEQGFWESQDLMQLHNEMLASADSGWDDLVALPDSWLRSDAIAPFRKRLLNLLEADFADSSLFVVKDPRI
jgi:hypothetical protein